MFLGSTTGITTTTTTTTAPMLIITTCWSLLLFEDYLTWLGRSVGYSTKVVDKKPDIKTYQYRGIIQDLHKHATQGDQIYFKNITNILVPKQHLLNIEYLEFQKKIGDTHTKHNHTN